MSETKKNEEVEETREKKSSGKKTGKAEGAADTAGKSKENLFVSDLCADFRNLFFDECICQFEVGDAFHRFGANIGHSNLTSANFYDL